jgi:hypothetical protein
MRWFIFPLVACMALACTPPPPSAPPDAALEEPEAPEYGPDEGVAFVNWSVLNEANIAEYRISRGETREGPWTLIATEEGQGPGLHGQQVYHVEERGLEIGQVLYYLIEQVNTEGMVAPPIGPFEYTVQAVESAP